MIRLIRLPTAFRAPAQITTEAMVAEKPQKSAPAGGPGGGMGGMGDMDF
jgi:chaperonin GroEL